MEEILRSLPEPMRLNFSILIIAGIFLVLVLVLNQLIFKPLVGILDERKKLIEEGAEAHRKSLQTVEEKQLAFREAVTEARKRAMSRRQQILKESEMGRNEIVTSSKEKAMAMVQATATDIEKQVEKARETLRQESHHLAQKIVASVLSRAS